MKIKRVCLGGVVCNFLKSRVGFSKKMTFQGSEESDNMQISVKRVFQERSTVSAKTLRQEYVWPALETE